MSHLPEPLSYVHHWNTENQLKLENLKTTIYFFFGFRVSSFLDFKKPKKKPKKMETNLMLC